MADKLAHRGPDDSGTWVDSASGIALGHRRLSILDLSPTGRQPMESASTRYMLVFNGEIYNHLDLRNELGSAVAWRGRSDTETLLAGFESWGIAATLSKSVGMYALAVWDRRQKTLTLARDRMGEKPLFYGWDEGVFLFASELKALRVHPAFKGCIDPGAVALYLRYGYIPAPYSIYKGICKLAPGATVEIGGDTAASPSPKAYWSLRDVAARGIAEPLEQNEADAVEHLERLLRDAIAGQQVADVPLGAFLSGGIDSSLVVALLQTQSERPIKTFTIGFSDPRYNEAESAKAIAQHLGTQHSELYVTPHEALAVVPRLAELYDEPFGDPSAIPTLLVAQMARREVTVALSGDGGDELFAGYGRYHRTASIWSALCRIPRFGRRILRNVGSAFSVCLLDRFSQNGPFSEGRASRLASYLQATTMEEFYRVQILKWKNLGAILPASVEPCTVLTDAQQWLAHGGLFERMAYLDAVSYLVDDVLVKVDRAAMATSLETRVPLLDHRVVEFAWRVPQTMKVVEGRGKWILRQLLDKFVPRNLVDRPKMGFGAPIDEWLRGPLRDWAEALLAPQRLRREGFFRESVVEAYWRQHIEGKRQRGTLLWVLLCFQAWLESSNDISA